MERSRTVPLAIIVGGAIVAGALYVSTAGNPFTDFLATTVALVRPVDATDHILGNPAAKVMLIEYTDFDCESCASFHATLEQVVATEGAGGAVALVLREFPLADARPSSRSHARAAECVAQVSGNGAFWRFADALFANRPVDPLRYGTLAKDAGVVDDAFTTCYANASETVDPHINADRQNALDMGAKDAPFSLILVEGKPPVVMGSDYPYDVVRQLVEAALAH